MFEKKLNIFRQPKVYNPPPEQRKKSVLPKMLAILLFLVIILGTIIYLLFYSSIFQIKNIIVENPANPFINQEFDKLKGTNILLFKSSQVKENIIKSFPDVTDLKVIRGLPDTLKIQLNGRQSKIVWQTQGKNFYVSSDGRIYKEVEGMNDLPQVIDNKDLAVEFGQVVASENFINFIVELNSSFFQTMGFAIIGFEINETIFQVDALTDQGWKVIFDTLRPIENQLADLGQFLSEHKDEAGEYIDLRVEGRVYYK